MVIHTRMINTVIACVTCTCVNMIYRRIFWQSVGHFYFLHGNSMFFEKKTHQGYSSRFKKKRGSEVGNEIELFLARICTSICAESPCQK